MNLLAAFIAIIYLLLANTTVIAGEFGVSNEVLSVLEYLTDKNGNYAGPTVEENVAKMDTDKNGFADVFEVRAYLISIHGNDYQKDLLDKWQASASGKSCSTPFAKELYTDKTK